MARAPPVPPFFSPPVTAPAAARATGVAARATEAAALATGDCRLQASDGSASTAAEDAISAPPAASHHAAVEAVPSATAVPPEVGDSASLPIADGSLVAASPSVVRGIAPSATASTSPPLTGAATNSPPPAVGVEPPPVVGPASAAFSGASEAAAHTGPTLATLVAAITRAVDAPSSPLRLPAIASAFLALRDAVVRDATKTLWPQRPPTAAEKRALQTLGGLFFRFYGKNVRHQRSPPAPRPTHTYDPRPPTCMHACVAAWVAAWAQPPNPLGRNDVLPSAGRRSS